MFRVNEAHEILHDKQKKKNIEINSFECDEFHEKSMAKLKIRQLKTVIFSPSLIKYLPTY